VIAVAAVCAAAALLCALIIVVILSRSEHQPFIETDPEGTPMNMNRKLTSQGVPHRDAIAANIDGPNRVHLTGVLTSPPFTYTVGLSPVVGYEILIVGMRHELAGLVLNDIAEALHAGSALAVDVPDDRWCTAPVVFKRADSPLVHSEYVCVADWYYERDGTPVLQMVMSDRAGLFPWHAGFDHAYMDPRQPRLWTERTPS
jgi:hypothetical protein